MCLTDVVVRDFNSTCLRSPHPSVLTSPAFKYLQNMEEKICHIEVGERRGGERGGGGAGWHEMDRVGWVGGWAAIYGGKGLPRLRVWGKGGGEVKGGR